MKIRLTIFALLLFAVCSFAQLAPSHFQVNGGTRSLDDDTVFTARLVSNSIIDILPTNTTGLMWLGTGHGATRMYRNPPSFSFETYTSNNGIGKGGVSGILWSDSIIWVATAFDTLNQFTAGGGLAYSRDQGIHWTWLPQPRDQRYNIETNGRDSYLGYWPTTTNVQNITYDIAMSDSFVWIASFAGGLRKHRYDSTYTDFEDSTGWRVVTPDTDAFHPVQNLNHRVFAVLYAEDALWVGTAGGINKSTDEGRTWRNFNSANTSGGISGNFITALAYQETTHTIWAATWRAEANNEFYAVSKTSDGGATWSYTLTEDQIEAATGQPNTPRAHNFGFDDNIAYVCDDIGLWKSTDLGANWYLFPRMEDSLSHHRFGDDAIYSTLSEHERFWVGGADGLALSTDGGVKWKIFQAAVPLDDRERPTDTYAMPNPWSPARFGPVKLRYVTNSGGGVKVTIYDFSMTKVVELPSFDRAAGEQYENWDGRKNGVIVANGTYFYKIEKPGGEVWGKLIVLD